MKPIVLTGLLVLTPLLAACGDDYAYNTVPRTYATPALGSVVVARPGTVVVVPSDADTVVAPNDYRYDHNVDWCD